MTDRRDALKLLATGTALPFLARLVPDEILALGRSVHALNGSPGEASALKALDARADRTLVAACERILPASDTPGATAAGVNRFIDRMLADWYPPAERDAFLAGLRELDARSGERHGRDFAECSAAEQTAILSALDDEAAKTASDAHWFARLKFLSIWGYCTSEAGMTAVLHEHPLGLGRYEGCAPVGSTDEPPSS